MDGFQVIDRKNAGLQKHIRIPFGCHFLFLIKKSMLCRFRLTVTLQMMSTNCSSVSSISVLHVRLMIQYVCYSPDEELGFDFIYLKIITIYSHIAESSCISTDILSYLHTFFYEDSLGEYIFVPS
jgi:hypothetical protein